MASFRDRLVVGTDKGETKVSGKSKRKRRRSYITGFLQNQFRVESIGLNDREKQNEIRIWPKKKQRYGYQDRSPSIKILLSKSLRKNEVLKRVNLFLASTKDFFSPVELSTKKAMRERILLSKRLPCALAPLIVEGSATPDAKK
ncbi:hypothetical protein POM88_001747 [Heracleum sosnowskyi]|uniref:Uncharacterized protein n=1 Tax=Heracleum sosnowskyi TaxID=360622 RepID=A0AAD8JD41_9APIA|nr:hypothetical protein POM88_001747 [Heracleum sosnowskyi]